MPLDHFSDFSNDECKGSVQNKWAKPPSRVIILQIFEKIFKLACIQSLIKELTCIVRYVSASNRTRTVLTC